jgi:hypothetical protein
MLLLGAIWKGSIIDIVGTSEALLMLIHDRKSVVATKSDLCAYNTSNFVFYMDVTRYNPPSCRFNTVVALSAHCLAILWCSKPNIKSVSQVICKPSNRPNRGFYYTMSVLPNTKFVLRNLLFVYLYSAFESSAKRCRCQQSRVCNRS